MGFLLNFWMMIDGFKTIGGLVLAGSGVVMKLAGQEEAGQNMTDAGLLLMGVGAMHGGIKKHKGQ